MIDSTDRGRTATADARIRDVEPGRPVAEPSIGTLLKELRDETTILVRQEVALARTELSEKASKVARNTASLAAGSLIAYAGLMFILLAITAGVYLAFAEAEMAAVGLWAAPLIVGLVVSLIGVALLMKGKNGLQKTSPIPEQTVETMKENKEWVREKV